MALNPTAYSTRSLSLVLLAAMAGIGLWLFAPSFGIGGGGSGADNGPATGLPAMLRADGDVVAGTDGGLVRTLAVPLSLRGEGAVELTGGRMRVESALAETALAAVPASYEITWLSGDGDALLETGERALLRVTLAERSSVRAEDPLAVVFTPADGPALRIEDALGD